MNLSNTQDLFCPNGLPLEETTHLCIAAHQDDVEIMAAAPILECFGKSDKHFTAVVVSDGAGSDHRNHCPYCLSSQHLDNEPGDREADCGGVMEAISVWVRKGGEWAIIHRCRICGQLSSNRTAADDNPLILMSVALKPLGNPPFPLERIEELSAFMSS